jgi:coproporphyrinogen III oxidase-like Fe-S oxidoreductase
MIDHPTRDVGFGVYVHWPFCASKCPYCDFNSHVRHQPVDQERFLAAFRQEIAHTAARIPGRTVTSIFFGGGTPSLMRPETVGAILDAIGGFAATTMRASTGSRSACRRSTIPTCGASGACIRSRKPWRR